MFTVAAVALVALHELGEPYPFTDVTRGASVDELYATADAAESGRADRMAFVVAAGGEVMADGTGR